VTAAQVRNESSTRTEMAMGTLVTIQTGEKSSAAEFAVGRAFAWFHEIESRCTRFSDASELMRLSSHIGEAVPVSAILLEAVQFALKVAEESGGAFDPTVGHTMVSRGFNRNYRTGQTIDSPILTDERVSYRDVVPDPDRQAITLRRPLTLDLGAVVKGLAVDMAAAELALLRDFAIDAGGDLYLGGRNAQGESWSVGIRNPRGEGLISRVRVSDQAVCTSGDYERTAPDGSSHIVDGRTRSAVTRIASVTVVASGAMLADALATAAFVLGPEAGIQFLCRMGVEGLIVTADLKTYQTGDLFHVA
jgi:FAD:protein FMN transferase